METMDCLPMSGMMSLSKVGINNTYMSYFAVISSEMCYMFNTC